MALSGWPVLVDDDGSLTIGTVINKALFDSIKASIEADLYSTANPAITAENIIDEVVTARGSKASLDARLDVALNEDGTLKTQAGLATVEQVSEALDSNWCYNEDFLIWAAGDAVAPTGWTLATITCARAGTGLGDTTTKVGPYCAKLTRSGSNGTLTQNIMNSTSFGANGQHLKGTDFSFGAWLKTSVASMVRVYFNDGISTTVATDEDSNTYHPGNGTWIWFSGTHTISNSATALSVVISVEASNGDCYVSGVTAVPGSVAPSNWRPCPKTTIIIPLHVPSTLTTGTAKAQFTPLRPCLIKQMWAYVRTAPTGQSILLDFNVWDGSAYQSMFSGSGARLDITTSAGRGIAYPEGTYRYRCLTASNASLTITNAILSLDIDQVGSGVAGADLYCIAFAVQYDRPQESLLDRADF